MQDMHPLIDFLARQTEELYIILHTNKILPINSDCGPGPHWHKTDSPLNLEDTSGLQKSLICFLMGGFQILPLKKHCLFMCRVSRMTALRLAVWKWELIFACRFSHSPHKFLSYYWILFHQIMMLIIIFSLKKRKEKESRRRSLWLVTYSPSELKKN